MKPQLYTNVRIFDGTGVESYPGEVLVDGNLICAVAPGARQIPRESNMEVIDGCGNTLMPGMCEAHSHITYTNLVNLREVGEVPPEEHVLLTILNAKLMLDSGFTSLYSAASAKIRTEVVVRNAIDAGKIPGPRLRAASPEIVSTGGLGDARQLHMHHQSFEIIADGADEVRRTVRLLIREGVDNVKLNISGDNFTRKDFGRKLSYTDAEVAAAAEEAHERNAWLSCHARSDSAVRMALRHGFRVIYHLDFIEGQTFDLLEAKKKDIFLAPAIGVIYTTAYEAASFGVTEEIARQMGMMEMLEGFPRVYKELWKRGLRILPGGDYGFAWNPIGNDARDLEHFVNMLGISPAEALMTTTKWGGEIMGIANLGLVKEGFLADLLIVRGDPTSDIKLLQDRDNLLMIMKDGIRYKHAAADLPSLPVSRRKDTTVRYAS
jgi:imidazolonepropionase-like amidohydrolase